MNQKNKAMTNKHLPFVALAATAIAVSCSTDDLTEQEQYPTEGKTVTLTASVDGNRTRVGMTKSEDGTTASFYWHKDDKILVQTKKSDGTYSGAEFSTTETATGAASATFTGEVIGTVGQYAVYPYNESHKFTDEKTLTYNLPASYTYTTVGSNIFSKEGETGITYPSNSTNMPMLGTIADGTISFKHIGGLAVIRIDKMPAESGTLTVTADKQISGNFVVDLSAETPVIATASTETETDKHVTFTFCGATEGGIGVFYLPLATGAYTNMRFEIKDKTTNTWWMFRYKGTLSIARAGVTAVPLAAANMGHIVKNSDGTYTVNDQYKFIDLGLSVLWADTNIGANKKTDDGNYFAWGETKTKSDYSRKNYAYYDVTNDCGTKYYDEIDEKAILEAEDDAATAHWGVPCRMPTNEEVNELMEPENCTLSWMGFGYKVMSIDEDCKDHFIILPASGYYDGTTLGNQNIMGYYWTSSACTDGDSFAYAFTFSEKIDFRKNPLFRFWGCQVRPVAEKPIAKASGQK